MEGEKTALPDIDNGKHSEMKGINAVEQEGNSTKGMKQVSSHNACNPCEKVQNDKGVINITGSVTKDGSQSRPLNPYKEY